MNNAPDPFYPFLKAARGSWRNTLYLHCEQMICPHCKGNTCGRFLMAADADGVPLLVPVQAFEAFSGDTVLPEECAGVLDKHAFESVYAQLILWRVDNPSDCPLKTFCIPI